MEDITSLLRVYSHVFSIMSDSYPPVSFSRIIYPTKESSRHSSSLLYVNTRFMTVPGSSAHIIVLLQSGTIDTLGVHFRLRGGSSVSSSAGRRGVERMLDSLTEPAGRGTGVHVSTVDMMVRAGSVGGGYVRV